MMHGQKNINKESIVTPRAVIMLIYGNDQKRLVTGEKPHM